MATQKNANNLGLVGDLVNAYVAVQNARNGVATQLSQPSKPTPAPIADAGANGGSTLTAKQMFVAGTFIVVGVVVVTLVAKG